MDLVGAFTGRCALTIYSLYSCVFCLAGLPACVVNRQSRRRRCCPWSIEGPSIIAGDVSSSVWGAEKLGSKRELASAGDLSFHIIAKASMIKYTVCQSIGSYTWRVDKMIVLWGSVHMASTCHV
jgi:hypothetical protein